MRPRPPGGRLRQDRRGATIVEFALVCPILVMMLLALFDLGYRMYLQSVIEGTLHRAARMATIGTTSATSIDDFVRRQLQAFTVSNIDIQRKSYYQFSGVSKAEQDDNDDGVCAAGEYFVDENRNGRYDNGSNSGTTGLGGSDDIVFYTVTVTFNRLFPLSRFLGWTDVETASANTVLRNQPYGSQSGLPSKTACP